MTTPSRPTRVLRIAIVVNGKILQEKLIEFGDSVRVGESEKNTFVLPRTHLEAAEHQLFKASGRGYLLQLTDGMKGRISCGGGMVVSLEKLARDPSAARTDGAVWLPLTEQDRGKIVIDGVTVLFQFVVPPPLCVATPLQQMDFRPRLLEEDAPMFLGFLGLWSALASILVIWVWSAEPPAYEMTDLPDRIAKLTAPPRVVLPDVEPEIDEEVDGTPIDKAPDLVPEDRVAAKRTDTADAPRDEADVRADVLDRSRLLAALIGTKGDSPTHAADIWSEDEKGLADIDKALAHAQGVTTDASHAGPRSGGGGTDRAAEIDDLVGVGGGQGRSVVGPAVSIATVQSEPGEIEVDEGDGGEVAKTIRRYAGELNYCYEKRLKARPDLAGRVDVSWVVEDGAVVGTPWIVANTTDDDELAKCVQQRIRRWRFEGFAGEANNPFIFQPK